MVETGHLLNALRAFEAAARLGSVRKAAQDLSVTDGAVSRQIKHLEDALGVELFERGNRSIRLTPAAAEYAATISEAFASIARGTEQLRHAHNRQTIMLTAPDAFLLRWLVPRLQSLEALLDGTSVRLTTWSREINPADRSIDIYIGVGPVPEIPGMTVAVVAPETFGPVVSPMLVKGREDDLDYLWSLPRLDTVWPPDMWSNWAREAGVTLKPREFISYDLLFYTLQAAEAGLGVTIGPGPAVSDAIKQGRMLAPLGLVTRPGSWYLAWRNDRSLRVMKLVQRWFEREFAE
jgi:LysR family glycine cleavage system transcriptional activator